MASVKERQPGKLCESNVVCKSACVQAFNHWATFN